MVGYYYATAITNAVLICHQNRLKTKNMLELKVNQNIFLYMFSQGGELCFTALLQHRPAGPPAARRPSRVSNDVHKWPSGGGSPHLQPDHKPALKPNHVDMWLGDMENSPVLALIWADLGGEPSSEPRTATADITPSHPRTKSWQSECVLHAKLREEILWSSQPVWCALTYDNSTDMFDL